MNLSTDPLSTTDPLTPWATFTLSGSVPPLQQHGNNKKIERYTCTCSCMWDLYFVILLTYTKYLFIPPSFSIALSDPIPIQKWTANHNQDIQ